MIWKQLVVGLALVSWVVLPCATAAPQLQQASTPATKPSSTAASNEQVEDKHTLAEEERIVQEGQRQIAEKRKRADEQIARLTGVSPSAVRDPYAIRNAMQGHSGASRNQIMRGGFVPAFSSSFFEINSINMRFEADKRAIENDCQKRIAVLRELAANARSQMKPGTSGIQATPIGSNAYVRNIVNYSDEQFHVAPQSAKAGVWNVPRSNSKANGHGLAK